MLANCIFVCYACVCCYLFIFSSSSVVCYENCNLMRFPCWSFVLVDSKSRLETKITRCHGISSFNDERKTFRLTTECVAEYLHFENRPPFIIISSELIFCVLLLLLLLFFLIPNFNSFVVYTETRLTCYILEITRSCAVCSLRRIMGKPWLRSGPLHSIFATLRTLAYRQAVSDRYTWHLITQWWRKKSHEPHDDD